MSQKLQTAPETKSAEASAAFEDFMRAFDTFKDANDERLSQIEHKVAADVVTVDKVDRINRALDEQKRAMDQILLRNRRPALGGSLGAAMPGHFATEHKAAFDAYVRGGSEDGLRTLEGKALAVGTNSGADGGYLVPDETEREIGRRLTTASPIRAISGVRQISSNVYKKPFATTGAATGWTGETDSRAETTTPTLTELEFPAMELYAMPAASATLLDDSAVNIDEWLASEVELAFATQEGTAFVTGDGNKKPTGFMSYTKIAEASWAWTKIGYVKTGVSGDFAASNPADNLVDLAYALKAAYRQNATHSTASCPPRRSPGGRSTRRRRRAWSWCVPAFAAIPARRVRLWGARSAEPRRRRSSRRAAIRTRPRFLPSWWRAARRLR